MPNFFKSKHLNISNNGNEISFGNEIQHYFLSGGYVFNLSEKTKFKPSFMLKSALNISPSLDLSTNFLFFDKFELGASYRLEDFFGLMANFAITPNLRIGYAYDNIISDIKIVAPASLEFMLLFDLNFSKKVSVSPRFFQFIKNEKNIFNL